MSSTVLLRHGDQWLALSPEALRDALELANNIMPNVRTTTATEDDSPLWLNVPQVSRLCNVSETHLRDEIALGNIKTRRFGRSVRIHRDFLEHQTSHLDRIDDGDE